MYYPDQFTPAAPIDHNEWRPRLTDLAMYGATGEAVDRLTGPEREMRKWVVSLTAESVYSVENAIARAKQESCR